MWWSIGWGTYTRGDPPSPLHESCPRLPPAQMKLGCNRKCLPKRVARSFIWQKSRGTVGNSTRFKITWYFPSWPKRSLPHPDTKHWSLSNIVFGGGKQAVFTFSAIWMGVSRNSNAISLYKLLFKYSGWMTTSRTVLSWCGKISSFVWPIERISFQQSAYTIEQISNCYLCIPIANTNFQLLCFLSADTMGSCQNDWWLNQWTTACINIHNLIAVDAIDIQHSGHPREFWWEESSECLQLNAFEKISIFTRLLTSKCRLVVIVSGDAETNTVSITITTALIDPCVRCYDLLVGFEKTTCVEQAIAWMLFSWPVETDI